MSEKQKSRIDEQDILQFAEDYCQKLDEVKRDQPYHLNIIEELHINENAHSRILAKLLQYKDKDGEYVFLKSLLEYINGIKPKFPKLDNLIPKITQEKNRIDVLVLTKDFAIIIENKVCEAKDQYKQLHRYIEKVRDLQRVNGNDNYEDKYIFIVYLTKYNQSPSSDTWSSKREESDFSARFLNLSYMYDILSWLKKEFDILPCKEIELRSALEQYVNYLEILKKGFYMEKDLKKFFDGKFQGNLENVLDGYNKTKELVDFFPTYVQELIKDKTDWIKDEDIFEDKNPKKFPRVVNLLYKKSSEYFLYLELSEELDFVKCCLEQKNGKSFNLNLLTDLKNNNITLHKVNNKVYVTREDVSLTNDNLEMLLDDFKKIYDFLKCNRKS